MNDHELELNNYFETLRADIDATFSQKNIDSNTSRGIIEAINTRWEEILDKLNQIERECAENSRLLHNLTVVFLKTGNGLLDDKLLIMNIQKSKLYSLTKYSFKFV